MDAITSAQIERWLRSCATVFPAHKDELNDLDSAIGDGDHGANMARGFTAIPPKLDALAGQEIDGLFRTTATTLISQVGGRAARSTALSFSRRQRRPRAS